MDRSHTILIKLLIGIAKNIKKSSIHLRHNFFYFEIRENQIIHKNKNRKPKIKTPHLSREKNSCFEIKTGVPKQVN